MPSVNYVLVTPAKNEEEFIENTIQSVASQTLLPRKWIIVDDASTDRTAEIVRKYLPSYGFINLLKLQALSERSFVKKVAAFNAGLMFLKDTEYSFIGNLDGDISLAPNYYENIIGEFQKDPQLGIAGGIVYTAAGQKFVTDDSAPDSVAGAVQLFRKGCFEHVGGYLPLEQGGIDAAAEITARMKGWTVKKFPENKVYEHRRTGTAGNRLLVAKYKEGVRCHSLGYNTIFYILKSIYKMKSTPFLIGSAVSLLGFVCARAKNYPVHLPAEVVTYLRSEQLGKLRRRLFGKLNRAFSAH